MHNKTQERIGEICNFLLKQKKWIHGRTTLKIALEFGMTEANVYRYLKLIRDGLKVKNNNDIIPSLKEKREYLQDQDEQNEENNDEIEDAMSSYDLPDIIKGSTPDQFVPGKKKLWSLRDIYLTSLLMMNGHKLRQIRRVNENRCEFLFEDTPELHEIRRRYMSQAVMVNLSQFKQQMSQLKQTTYTMKHDIENFN